MHRREDTRSVKVGGVTVGGGADVSVQSMANVSPHDADALAAQAESCAAAGCDIFRLTVPDAEAARVLGEVRRRTAMPIVADIHFDWTCAIAAIEAGADALRINPGNIGSHEKVRAVARAAAARRIPIRVGVNMGSLQRDLDAKLRSGAMLPAEALCESAIGHIALLEAEGFRDIVVSAKASNVIDTVATYRMLADKVRYPLHIGVTEAGTLLPGAVRNSVALGILLSEGIGDTIRVSLTAPPEREVLAGAEILRSLGLRASGPSIVSCPTCGRTRVDLFKTAAEVEEAMEALYRERSAAQGHPPESFPKVAVMGCAVNGPGEARGADVALCGGDGDWVIFVKGIFAGRASQADAVRKVVEHVVSL